MSRRVLKVEARAPRGDGRLRLDALRQVSIKVEARLTRARGVAVINFSSKHAEEV